MKSQEHARRRFLNIMGAGAASTILPGCQGPSAVSSDRQASNKPNIILILCDDLGYADVGCYGAKGLKTPNIDRMAAEGLRFTDFYMGAPVCSPSRAALMTGCYPQRVGLPQVLEAGTLCGLSKEEETIPEILKATGYTTAMYGKWHLGDRKEFLPLQHGFDDYFGLPYSNDMWPNHPTKKNFFPDLPLMEGNQVIALNPDQSKLTGWYTDRAVKFMEKNKDRPFFMYLPHTFPHVPLFVSERFKGKSGLGLFGDVIMELDWSVGEIFKTLKRLGIDGKTLVVFTSDNGPWLTYGNHAGSAAPLRDGKTTTFDGGHRVPCIVRWPGRIPAGKTCRELATGMDLLPTFAELGGAKLPVKRIDGKDIWPLMSGLPGAKSPHEAFFYYNSWCLEGVRWGKWKLQLPHQYYAVDVPGKDGMPGRQVWTNAGMELYDLEQDIGEKKDVSDDHPEVMEKMLELVAQTREDLGDGVKRVRPEFKDYFQARTLYQIKGKNIRPPGRVKPR